MYVSGTIVVHTSSRYSADTSRVEKSAGRWSNQKVYLRVLATSGHNVQAKAEQSGGHNMNKDTQIDYPQLLGACYAKTAQCKQLLEWSCLCQEMELLVPLFEKELHLTFDKISTKSHKASLCFRESLWVKGEKKKKSNVLNEQETPVWDTWEKKEGKQR